MNSPPPDDLINAPNEDIPAAIPNLIHAAVAALPGSGDGLRSRREFERDNLP
jgi:hypothetical protein